MLVPIYRLQKKILNQILFYNVSLIAIAITYYILKGFDHEEFSSLFALLFSVSAVYIGSLFQFIGGSLEEKETSEAAKRLIPSSTVQLINWLIPVHFFLVLLVISLKAFTFISFQEMNQFLVLVEGCFGGYMSYIISAIFNIKKSNSND